MMPFTPAVFLSWQIGASEAMTAHAQFVEKEHVLIGLLRALDVLDPDKQQGLKKMLWRRCKKTSRPCRKFFLPAGLTG